MNPKEIKEKAYQQHSYERDPDNAQNRDNLEEIPGRDEICLLNYSEINNIFSNDIKFSKKRYDEISLDILEDVVEC